MSTPITATFNNNISKKKSCLTGGGFDTIFTRVLSEPIDVRCMVSRLSTRLHVASLYIIVAYIDLRWFNRGPLKFKMFYGLHFTYLFDQATRSKKNDRAS